MGLAELLREDREFFEEYRAKFREKFLKLLKEYGVINNIRGNLNYIIDILYDSLLALDDKSCVEKLKNTLWELHKSNIPLGEILSEILWDFLKDYINYLEWEKHNGEKFKKVGILAENFNRFLEISTEVFMKYMESIGKSEKEEYIPKEAEEIIQNLEKFIRRPVEILGFYKVFPVLCKSRVLKVGDIFVTVERCPYKVFIPGEKILIKLPGKKGALAEIVNLEGNYMVVKPLRYKEVPFRKTVRVFPEKEIDVKIETIGKTIYGFMHYLTFDELGVITTSEDDREIKENQSVKVEFRLPNGNVKTKGYVIGVERINGARLIRIALENDFRNEQLISRYVLKRQQEILKEIKI